MTPVCSLDADKIAEPVLIYVFIILFTASLFNVDFSGGFSQELNIPELHSYAVSSEENVAWCVV